MIMSDIFITSKVVSSMKLMDLFMAIIDRYHLTDYIGILVLYMEIKVTSIDVYLLLKYTLSQCGISSNKYGFAGTNTL